MGYWHILRSTFGVRRCALALDHPVHANKNKHHSKIIILFWEFLSGSNAKIREKNTFLEMAPNLPEQSCMERQQTVSPQKMKDVLAREVGSRFPIKIILKNGDVMVRYVRGFADQQCNILLISENAFNLALRILEIKDIKTIEYAPEHATESWKVVHAKA